VETAPSADNTRSSALYQKLPRGSIDRGPCRLRTLHRLWCYCLGGGTVLHFAGQSKSPLSHKPVFIQSVIVVLIAKPIQQQIERKADMGVPKPLVKDQADSSIRELFEDIHAAIGKMPNIFGVMARFPAALKRFVPFYNAVMLKGRVPPKLKELAYLKTASINVCQY
jgi:hypothetical protein